MVVGLDLHQNMLHAAGFVVARHIAGERSGESLHLMPVHDGGVVRIRHHRVLRVGFVGVADHAEQTVCLHLTVNDVVSIENFVSAMLAVGLREHHQLGIGGVALEAGESLQQIIDFIVCQSQTVIGIRLHQRLSPLLQNVDADHVDSIQILQKHAGRQAVRPDRLGHAVVQQSMNPCQFDGRWL